MTTCCSILAWRIPWTEEPGRLQSIGFQRFGHKRSDLVHTHHLTYFSFSFSFSFSFFFLVRTFKFYSLGKLQLYHTVLSTIVTMLYQILRFYFYSLTAESLYPLTNLSLFPPTPGPGNNFCFYEFGFFFSLQMQVMCVCVCVLVTPSCSILCNPMDSSLPDSFVLGILQARILEWVVSPFSRGSS